MFDYNKWINEVSLRISSIAQLKEDFDEVTVEISIKPPLDEDALQDIVTSINIHIPVELQRFWIQATQNCDCRYVCRGANQEAAEQVERSFGHDQNFYGGVCFLHPVELQENLQTCKEWAEIFEEDPDPMQRTFWLNTLPFHWIGNGDYLGLDLSIKLDDPPVVYLSHDGESQIIAGSFTSFLRTWADLCYIGPEIWMLQPFQNATGFIDANSKRADSLRSLLRVND